ncbi:putative transcription factor MYB-HB-like family [Helianthus annuus]|nr:putative transcription factor MYB-HB-like family [Helianthus annuus]KAJ0712783.1 putative transcription factor MYB-HB-like family [Helianthus annuus]KAJ0889968.1 putative transcription factor MYB-HB-like family [Helianthus annuus]KAJ0894740.1 putative transcription factor MYB-HB-like family [Helianthus annuus]
MPLISMHVSYELIFLYIEAKSHIISTYFLILITWCVQLLCIEEMASSSNWTWEQNKLFENSLVTYNDDPDRFQKIAKIVGKSVEEVKVHYQNLVHDVNAIEAGKIPLPNYKTDEAKGQQNKKK